MPSHAAALPPPERGRSASAASRVGVWPGPSLIVLDPTPALRADPPLSGEGFAAALLGLRNASRLSEARLHAVSSRNMYSEHGFEARIGPDAGQVCQSFTVVWNCRPGSAEAQAAWPIFSHSARALSVFATPRRVRQVKSQSPSAS